MTKTKLKPEIFVKNVFNPFACKWIDATQKPEKIKEEIKTHIAVNDDWEVCDILNFEKFEMAGSQDLKKISRIANFIYLSK